MSPSQDRLREYSCKLGVLSLDNIIFGNCSIFEGNTLIWHITILVTFLLALCWNEMPNICNLVEGRFVWAYRGFCLCWAGLNTKGLSEGPIWPNIHVTTAAGSRGKAARENLLPPGLCLSDYTPLPHCKAVKRACGLVLQSVSTWGLWWTSWSKSSQ